MKTKTPIRSKILIETGGRQTGKTTRQIDWLISSSKEKDFKDCLFVAINHVQAKIFNEAFEKRTGSRIRYGILPHSADAIILGVEPNTYLAIGLGDQFQSLERLFTFVNQHKEIKQANIEWL